MNWSLAFICTIILCLILLWSKSKEQFSDLKVLDQFADRVRASFGINDLPTNQKGKALKEFNENNKTEIRATVSPFVTRPRTNLMRYQSPDGLYSPRFSMFGRGEFGTIQCPESDAQNYAMRPILDYNVYMRMMNQLFNIISDNIPFEVPDKDPEVNADVPDKLAKKVKDFIKAKLDKGKDTIPDFKKYARADTWHGEQFVLTNERLFVYNFPEFQKVVASFTLQNPLRSMSTDIFAIVLLKDKKMYLQVIGTSTKLSQETDFYPGMNVPNKVGNVEYLSSREESAEPQWIYANTINNQTFNLVGMHEADESNNILIPGGIPDEYKNIIERCDQGYIMDNYNSSQGPRFGGTSSNSIYQAPDIYTRDGVIQTFV